MYCLFLCFSFSFSFIALFILGQNPVKVPTWSALVFGSPPQVPRSMLVLPLVQASSELLWRPVTLHAALGIRAPILGSSGLHICQLYTCTCNAHAHVRVAFMIPKFFGSFLVIFSHLTPRKKSFLTPPKNFFWPLEKSFMTPRKKNFDPPKKVFWPPKKSFFDP